MVKKKLKKPVNSSEKVSIEKPEKKSQKKEEKLFLGADFVNPNLLKKLVPVIFIIFVMFFTYHMRSGPVELLGLDERIEANIYSGIRDLIGQQVSSQYPNLQEVYRQELVAEEFQKVLDQGYIDVQEQRIDLDQYVTQQVEQTKSEFQAENGQTYLTAIDPYHFLGLTSNYVENGHTGTEIIDGRPIVAYKIAPEMRSPGTYEPEFHVWLQSFLFNLNGVNSDSSVGEKTSVIFLIPVIVSMLAAIPAFMIIRRLSNDLFALFGTLLLVSIGTFVSRTTAGFVDTDAYNVFFPLLVVALLLYGFYTKKVWSTIILGFLAGFFIGIFVWAWGPGWFIFVFSIISIVSYLIYIGALYFIFKTSRQRLLSQFLNSIYLFLSFVIVSFISTLAFAGKNLFFLSYGGLTGSVGGLASISRVNIWPNVLSSVAELNDANFNQIMGAVGGNLIFFVSLLGVLLLALDFERKKLKEVYFYILVASIIWFLLVVYGGFLVSLTVNSPFVFLILLFLPIGFALLYNFYQEDIHPKVFVVVLLSVWLAGTIFMSLSGVRFILLMAPAFAIAFSLGLYYLSKGSNYLFSLEFKVKSKIAKELPGFILSTLFFLILFSPVMTQATNISKSATPNFDDTWYDAMYQIRDNSDENAIITSWWDFGHFFATVAERGVTFDGGSQGTPQAHWVGKLLLEEEEAVSHDILIMLVCGGNLAHDTMLSYTNGEARDAVLINRILYSTFGKDIETTRGLIANNPYYEFTEEQVGKIMSYLACENPRENYLITSGDMVGKGAVWAHWGLWDFTRKYVHDNYRTKSVEEIAAEIDENPEIIQRYVEELREIRVRSKADNVREDDLINRWFSPYPGYAGNTNCQTQDTTIVCQNGIRINVTNGVILTREVQGASFGRLILPSEQNGIDIIEQEGDGVLDITLIPLSPGNFNAVFSQAPLGSSLFTKLFYLEGYGTEKFEKFFDSQTLTNGRLIVWRVDWNGTTEDVTPEVVDISFE